MAVKLNLLPPEYGALGDVGKILKVTRALGVIGMALFFVFALGVSAFYIISTITLNGLNSDVDSLKSQIAAQKSSEQQIVLLKDRIGKIKTVMGLPDATANMTLIKPYISGFPPSATLADMSIDAKNVGLSAVFRTNADLSNFISQVSSDKQFATVKLTSFTFSGTTGYSVDITAAGK